MKYLKFCFVAVAALAMIVANAHDSAAQLVNSGFEVGPLVDDGSGDGKWQPFSSDAGMSSQATVDPRTGTGHLDLSLLSNDQFAGVFQDMAASEGDIVEFSGWHKGILGTVNTEIRIEWLDAARVEFAETPNSQPVPGSAYEPFSVSATAPAGTFFARTVYAIANFGANDAQMQAYVDDTRPVPEPASLARIGFAGLAIATMRRRK